MRRNLLFTAALASLLFQCSSGGQPDTGMPIDVVTNVETGNTDSFADRAMDSPFDGSITDSRGDGGGTGDGSTDIVVSLLCGNRVLDTGERCDDGNRNSTDGCSDSCQIEDGFSCPAPGQPCDRCGDGARGTAETCDDRNRTPNDGCDPMCQVEQGWDCSLSDCVAAECGDGFRAGVETCDDGNRLSGDGCSFRCTAEIGFVCITPGTACRRAVCGDSAVEADERCDDGNSTPNDGCSATCQLEADHACPTPGSPCVMTMCGDGIRAGLEGCDDGNTTPADGCDAMCIVEPDFACPTQGTPCRRTSCGDGRTEGSEECDDGNTTPADGCAIGCALDPFYRCQGSPSACQAIPQFVRIALFDAPMQQPQAVHYDPGRRSFVLYGYDPAQGNREVCLDGTLVGTDSRSRYGIGTALDGATYDPFTDRFLFIQQSGVLTEVDRVTEMVVRTVTLTDVGTGGGIQVADDGRLYVANHFEESIKVFDRMGTVPVATIPTPTDGPYLDNLFVIPGEGMIGYYNLPPGGTEEQFSFHTLDGALVGRSSIPGTLFANGQPFPARADGGEAAPDGGYFLVCSEYRTNGGVDNGICQLFSRRCSTDLECANRVPGTACKFGEPIPYCYAPARARDDRYEVAVGSMNNRLDVSRNDTVSDAVCLGQTVRITSVSSGDRGGMITVGADMTSVAYSPAPGFCGTSETFTYTSDLGGVTDTATVTVLVACVCGDNMLQQNEDCDDGNMMNGDGCSATCTTESRCGNRVIDPGESCDDGDRSPGDGCSPNCTIEAPG